MNTIFLLMAEFNTTQIELEKVCGKYLAMDAATARKRAKLQRLPFPVIRGESQKTPYLVSVQDLAAYIDELNAKARSDWQKMHNVA